MFLFLLGSLVPSAMGDSGSSKDSSSDDDCGPDLEGLWEAISPEDGSTLRLTLMRSNDCDQYSVQLSDTNWSFCAPDTNLGYGTADGSVTDNVLSFLITINCFNSDISITLPIDLVWTGKFLIGGNGSTYSKISCS